MHTRPAWGWGWGRRGYYGGGGGGGGGCASVSAILIVVLVLSVVFALVVYQPYSVGSDAVTKSTIQREPLPRGAVVETGYYTDELGWIGNQTKLTAGLKNFYEKTGVQPYLYLTETIGGKTSPTDEEVEAFKMATYDALFSDEAHLLLIFQEYDNQYNIWYMGGSQTKTVLDDEAMDILMDYIERYYYADNLTDEEFFSKAFDEAGKRIMQVTTSPWIPVLIVAGAVLILIVIYIWWRNAKKQKNIEAEQTEKILGTPLDSFGDKEAEDRAKKYDGPDQS